MKVELREIVDQLSEALNFADGYKVSAALDEGKIVGWVPVKVGEDGTLTPLGHGNVFKNIKALFDYYRY